MNNYKYMDEKTLLTYLGSLKEEQRATATDQYGPVWLCKLGYISIECLKEVSWGRNLAHVLFNNP